MLSAAAPMTLAADDSVNWRRTPRETRRGSLTSLSRPGVAGSSPVRFASYLAINQALTALLDSLAQNLRRGAQSTGFNPVYSLLLSVALPRVLPLHLLILLSKNTQRTE